MGKEIKMTGPEMQYVVTYKARNGEERSVLVGFLTESQERPEDSLMVTKGNNPSLPHITWEQFKERSQDLPSEFVRRVGYLLHRTVNKKNSSTTKIKKTAKKTVITITIEE